MPKRSDRNLLVGLDIGTSKVVAIVGEIKSDDELEIIGIGSHPSRGLKKGVVVNIESTVQSIQRAVEEAELMAGCEIRSVFAGIAGSHVRSLNSHGVVAIRDREVSDIDVQHVVDAAKAVAIPADQKILHVLPQEYVIDAQEGIRDPVGMSGMRLETEMYLVTIGSSHALNLRKSIERAGYKVRELVLEPLASSFAVVTDEEKELGVALIEMGAGTTDLAIFHEEKIRFLGTIAYGGGHVTSDIVHGIGVTQADAERLKEKYGCAYEPFFEHSDEVITLPSTVAQGDREIKRELLAHIIHQRMDEIFGLVNQQIRDSGFAGRLSAGVVLTGGAAAIMGAAELASDVFGTGARVGSPAARVGGLSDAVEAPRFSTAVGLALFGAHRMSLGAAGSVASGKRKAMSAPGVDRIAQRVKTWLQDFL